MRRQITINLILALAAAAGSAAAQTVSIPLVTVSDPNNAPDPLTGYGSVSYTYSIGKYDVTTAQYAAFLNSVATTGDPDGLYTPAMANALPTDGIVKTSNSSGYTYSVRGNGSVPVTEVNWGDAARFVNWMQNSEPTGPEGAGTTETGTYALYGGTSNAALMAVSRSATASWVLPSLNEWYKAAYYSGGGTNSAYWMYATQSDSTPSNVLSATGTNNANFGSSVIEPPDFGLTDPVNYVTAVGAFADSPSAYGTFDQSGDVWEWNETADGSLERGLRGGSFADDSDAMLPGSYDDSSPAEDGVTVGFRVAEVPASGVPEPGAAALIMAGAAMVYHLSKLGKRRKTRE